jgi:hypothetical protein
MMGEYEPRRCDVRSLLDCSMIVADTNYFWLFTQILPSEGSELLITANVYTDCPIAFMLCVFIQNTPYVLKQEKNKFREKKQCNGH